MPVWKRRPLSRRRFIRGTALGAAGLAGAALIGCGDGDGGATVTPGEPTAALGQNADSLLLTNGKILVMDAQESIASSLLIENGRIAALDPSSAADARTIDLEGRTVIPGLIDSHLHFVTPSQAPGHVLSAIETAFTIPDALSVLSQRATSVPAGEFITAIGGVGPQQFAENRWPSLAELDEAAPDHPIYFQAGFSGPSVTNSLGKQYFETQDVPVAADGTIGRQDGGNALGALLLDQTYEEAQRSALEYMAYAASLGLTTVLDAGGGFWFGVTVPPDQVQGGHDLYYDLWRQDRLTVRMRLRFGGGGSAGPDGVFPVIGSMENALETVGDGDEMLRVIGVGEFTVGGFGETEGVPFEEAYGQVAERGWSLAQHSASAAEHDAHIEAFEAVNAQTPLAPLRWTIEHGFQLTPDHLARLEAIGAGVTASNTAFLPITPLLGSAPYRDIVDSGVHAGASSDSSNISPMNPWLYIYYMVTGKNATGELVNDGQQITREEALRLYTTGSAWFSFDDDELGSLEAGKLADLVVLSDDYLSIEEEQIRTLSSVLTTVGGRVVHANGAFSQLLEG